MKLAALPFLLSSLSPNFAHYIPDLLFRLLRYRVLEGPTTSWDIIDFEMQKVFQSRLFAAPSKADLMEIATILSTEAWGDVGNELRVYLDYILKVYGVLSLPSFRVSSFVIYATLFRISKSIQYDKLGRSWQVPISTTCQCVERFCANWTIGSQRTHLQSKKWMLTPTQHEL
jgi:hypothetical protein